MTPIQERQQQVYLPDDVVFSRHTKIPPIILAGPMSKQARHALRLIWPALSCGHAGTWLTSNDFLELGDQRLALVFRQLVEIELAPSDCWKVPGGR